MKKELTERARATFTPGENGAPTRVKALLSICGQPNSNGRTYNCKIWEREIAKLQKRISQSQLLGMCDHPVDGRNHITDAAIRWEKVYLDSDGKTTIGEGVILQTEAGRTLEGLLKSGIDVGVSSRGFGSVDSNGQVGEDFELISFDAVLDPSVRSAEIQMVERMEKAARARPLTIDERIQRKRAGLPDIVEWGQIFDPIDGAGVVSNSSLDDPSDQKAATTSKAEPEADFFKRVATAAMAQLKRDIFVVDALNNMNPAALEFSGVDLIAKKMIKIICTERADGAIKVLSISDLDQTGYGGQRESRATFIDRVVLENQDIIRRRAGIGA